MFSKFRRTVRNVLADLITARAAYGTARFTRCFDESWDAVAAPSSDDARRF